MDLSSCWEESTGKESRGRNEEMGLGAGSGRVRSGLGSMVWGGREEAGWLQYWGFSRVELTGCARGLGVRHGRKESQDGPGVFS